MALELRYSFDEGSGSAAGDSSGNSRAGVISGATFTTGQFNTALHFDGTTNAVSSSWVGITGTGAISVSFWIKTTSTNSQFIVGWGGTTTGGDRFSILINGYGRTTSDHSLMFGTSNAVSAWDGLTDLFDGNWHHVAVIKAASANYDGLLLYLDGTLVGTSIPVVSFGVSTIDVANANPVMIGTYFDGSTDPFSGDLDDVRIYSSVLSSTEITDLSSGNVSAIAHLVGTSTLRAVPGVTKQAVARLVGTSTLIAIPGRIRSHASLTGTSTLRAVPKLRVHAQLVGVATLRATPTLIKRDVWFFRSQVMGVQ